MNQDSIVSRSWKRCRQYGLNPEEHQDAILDQASFLHRLEESHTFLQSIEPSIMRLFGWIRSIQSTVIVAGTDGYILKSIGDPVFLQQADRVHLMEGACWTEQVRGTNAIGTAIVEHSPTAVVGKEHYSKQNQFLCCASAPIFSPSGEMMAVLDVSGYHEQYHPSQLAMVDVVARFIEDWMLLQSPEHQLVVALVSQSVGNQQALIGVNSDGIVTGTNREARRLLQVDKIIPNKLSLSDLITEDKALLSRRMDHRPRTTRLVLPYASEQFLEASVFLDRRPITLNLSESMTTPLPKPASVSKVGIYRGTVTGNWTTRYRFEDIFCHDPTVQRTLELARRAAQTNYNIFVFGETGTGKEMVAQSIHVESPRKDCPFVSINCGSISESLLESELFGYEAGAFTGAKKTGHPGKFEQAHGGTLLLDEIAEMSTVMQTTLLRVLQEGHVVRIGGVRQIPVDVRIVAATHKDLWKEVEEGRFRSDLYFRLQGIQINLPPLRERVDLIKLVQYLLSKIKLELNSPFLSLTTEAQRLIVEYAWPGNVRELESALREASFLSGGEMIDAEHFPLRVRARTTNGQHYSVHGVQQSDVPNSSLIQNPLDLHHTEQHVILQTLRDTQGNISKAARKLGIGRSTLYRKLKQIPTNMK